MERCCGFLAGLLTFASIAWSLDLPFRLGIVIYNEQFLSAILALALSLTFLHEAGREDRPGILRIAAAVLSTASILVGAFFAWFYPSLLLEMAYKPWYGLIACTLLVFLTIEGIRRRVGLALTLVVLAFVAYALLRNFVPGRFGGNAVDPGRLVAYLGVDTNAILGGPLMVAATIVVAFIFMGQCLLHGGGGAFFRDISLVLFGRMRGGAGKIAIFSSMLFGLISGSAVGNVVSTGVMTIGIMKKGGFKPSSAAAIEAVASTGGQILPPVLGATAFLIAEFIQVPYSQIALAAIVPAFLYYLSLYLSVDFKAAAIGLAPVPRDEIPPAAEVLKSGWHVFLPLIALVMAMFYFNASPQFAAMIASAGFIINGLVFGYRGERMKLANLGGSFVSAGASVIDIVLICAAAGIVIGVMSVTGASYTMTLFLTDLAQGNLFLLLAFTALASIILGMGMPTVGVYVLLATLMGPALAQTGLSLIGAHLFMMYFGMLSMITPPVAIAAFAAASIAKAPMMTTAWEAMRLGWPAYIVPFIFVFEEGLLLQNGTAVSIFVEVATAAVGVACGTVALQGYFHDRIPLGSRVLFGAAGVTLLMPVGVLSHGHLLNIAGVALAAVAVSINVLRRHRAPVSQPAAEAPARSVLPGVKR
jgi:TRAP transporter 4TM/12TM fusion protein